ncbi:bifunctional adenosylcobinamide kinase/adenosylcobinamide-phosphate guanylyltransferase [Sporosarcina sp. OR05]|uniref:bifunctional adenosylcobinamide kinase/adenosylcobinamide-phosphate guanylyltransferase n=1 Tax=Sporosarcina sp. OR05 TaxID=2969819 RepID=UPI00352AFFC3
MHIIIGGAHNGKRTYVQQQLANTAHQWMNCEITENCFGDWHRTDLVVIEHIEKWLARTDLPEAQAIDHILSAVEGRNTLFILTDFGRGIVPMDAKQRALRDTCGRLYQQLFARADEVTRIWYGIPQTIKKRGERI